MKIRRIALIIAVIVMFGICYAEMNFHYDRLARYPYSNDDDRELILKYLNDDDINYIIEYSLEPSYFINYITCNNFSIYHADKYNRMKELFPYMSNSEVVYYTELFNSEGIDFETGCIYLKNYSKEELNYWMEHKDLYIPGSYLIEYPDSLSVNITKDTTISNHTPGNLIEVDDELKLKEEAYKKFNTMCDFINEEYRSSNCAGIKILKGYISYDDQRVIYDENQDNNIPGHDYHQTGLAMDLDLSNSIFKNHINEFIGILNKFGFITESCKNEGFHIRYKG